MRFNEIYKFSDGMLTRILEALDYKVKVFKVKRLNPGMNTRFWTEKDVTRSKEFIAAIERRQKTRRIYQNLECFVGGRCEHAGPKVTTLHGGNTTTRMIKRFTMADDLKESSKITTLCTKKFMHEESKTMNVLAVYIQQFWKTVKQVSDANNTIRFTINRETITYIVDMFRSTLQLLVETPNNPFVELEDLKFIQRFLKIVGYEVIVDKVSAFYTKNLAQPWQTMFKVFNRCLTTRTSRHDQTKINILQIFHVVINRVQVDYARLLWWDFIHCEFLPDEIRATIKYKEYEKVFVGIDVPTIQPQPVESTQRTNRRPKATRTPTPTAESVQKKRKSKIVTRESSIPRKSLKVTIRQKKPSATSMSPLSDDRERDEIAETTILSLTKHKTALAVEAQENIAKDEEDTGTRIKPESHKEHPEVVIDDNVDKENKEDDVNDDFEKEKKDDEKDDSCISQNKVSSSLETRNEQMQTPILSPLRSPRNDLSFDKTISEELTANVSPTLDTTSKDLSMTQPTSSTHKVLPGSVAELSRRHGQLMEQLTNTIITKEYFEGKMKEMSNSLNHLVLELTVEKTNELIKEAITRMVNDAIKKDREIYTDVVPDLVSKEFATYGPKIIKEQFKRHMKNKVLNVHPIVNISTTTTTADLKQQLYLTMKTDL
ncbi:hypothetical protein Tco_0144732 [Tanacetum coccineum]